MYWKMTYRGFRLKCQQRKVDKSLLQIYEIINNIVAKLRIQQSEEMQLHQSYNEMMTLES